MESRQDAKPHYSADEFDACNLVWSGLVGVALGALASMLKAHRSGRVLSAEEMSFIQAGFEKCLHTLRDIFGDSFEGSSLEQLATDAGVPPLPEGAIGAMVMLEEPHLRLLEDIARNSWVWTSRPRECQAVIADLVSQFKDGLERATAPPGGGRNGVCEN